MNRRALLSGLLPGLLLTSALFGCATTSARTEQEATSGQRPTSAEAAETHGPQASTPEPLPSASAERSRENATRKFGELVDGLSEKDEYFFSDNLISNETSYLQTAAALDAHKDPTGVYVGVGPEQNFSYIALTRPTMAFIVDIRRANMLLHLLYRATFEEAQSRAEFVALLLGRGFDPKSAEAKEDGVSRVLDLAVSGPSSEETFEAVHARLMKRVTGYGVQLDKADAETLKKAHREFFEDQLSIHFVLKEANGRVYPSLKDLLSTRSPDGKLGGFLSTDDHFRFLKSMQEGGRIVPIVGDFAGDKALPELASYLSAEGKTVRTFYVSNVEQYLLEPKVWKKWVRNVKALPKSDESIFVRGYMDQGKKHPKQMNGHRTATVHTRMVDFENSFGNKPTTSFYLLCTDKAIAP
jgi:hypothetical protein